jgi:hypothetical protein
MIVVTEKKNDAAADAMANMQPDGQFYGDLENVLNAELNLFRDYVVRSTINCLYYQNMHLRPSSIPTDRSDGQSPSSYTPEEGWLQWNFYQAIITMKESLLLDFNPVPVLKQGHHPNRDASKLISTRQAVDCVLDEADLDRNIPLELLNLLIFGNSWRFTMPWPKDEEFEATEPECPTCEILLDVEHTCPRCEQSYSPNAFAQGPDHRLNLDIVLPWWVMPVPIVSSSGKTSILVRSQVITRSEIKDQLRVMLPDKDTCGILGSKVMDTPVAEDVFTASLPSLSRLFRLAQNIISMSRTFGDVFPAVYGGAALGTDRRLARFYVQIWVRRDTFNDEHGDCVLHFLEGQYIGTSQHKIDDHWVHIVSRDIPGRVLGDGEDALINQQDALNNLLSLGYTSAQSRSFGLIAAARDVIDVDDYRRVPNMITTVGTAGPESQIDLNKMLVMLPGQSITGDVTELRQAIVYNMQISGQTLPVLFGQLPPGVEAYKAIEVLRAQSLRAMRPFLTNEYKGHLQWVKQSLRLGQTHWKEARESTLNGIYFPVDPSEIDPQVGFRMEPSLIVPTGERESRQRVMEGLQLGLIDPTDPLNRVELLSELSLERFERPLITEIESQNEEIEEMIERRQMVPIAPRADNHLVHFYIVRNFLRSDYGRYLRRKQPEIYHLIEIHGQIHAYIADGKIERAVNEMTKAGILNYMLDADREKLKSGELKAELDMVYNRQKAELERQNQLIQQQQQKYQIGQQIMQGLMGMMPGMQGMLPANGEMPPASPPPGPTPTGPGAPSPAASLPPELMGIPPGP